MYEMTDGMRSGTPKSTHLPTQGMFNRPPSAKNKHRILGGSYNGLNTPTKPLFNLPYRICMVLKEPAFDDAVTV